MPGEGVRNKEKMKLSKDAVNCITSRLVWWRGESIKDMNKRRKNEMLQGLFRTECHGSTGDALRNPTFEYNNDTTK